MMMNKRRSSRVNIYRYALLACLVCGVLLSLNFTKPGAAVNEAVSNVVDDVKIAFAGEAADSTPKPIEVKFRTVADSVVFKSFSEKEVKAKVVKEPVTVADRPAKPEVLELKAETITLHGKVNGIFIADKTKGDKANEVVVVGKPGNGRQGEAVVVEGRPSRSGANLVLHSTSGEKQPLFVVDGVPLEKSEGLGDIDANTIESVTVLKDAASSALYGPKGGNGVILITTKTGKVKEKLATVNEGAVNVDWKTTQDGKPTEKSRWAIGEGTSNEKPATNGKPAEKSRWVIGEGTSNVKPATNGQGLEEVTVTGYPKRSTATGTVFTYNTTTVVTDSVKPLEHEMYKLALAYGQKAEAETKAFQGQVYDAAAGHLKSKEEATTVGASVSPNPTTGQVSVAFNVAKGENGFIEVVNLDGRQVYYKPINGFSGNYRATIDIRNNPAGTYVLKIVLGGRARFSSKIVKQ